MLYKVDEVVVYDDGYGDQGLTKGEFSCQVNSTSVDMSVVQRHVFARVM